MERCKRCRTRGRRSRCYLLNEEEEGTPSQGSSGVSASDLPLFIVADILSRLPLSSIIHCRCVCKTWLNLISDPYFSNLRLTTPQPITLVLRYTNDPKFSLLELQEDCIDSGRLRVPIFWSKPAFNLSSFRLKVVDSCNGLLCLCDSSSYVDSLYICNPILGEYITLPKPKIGKKVEVVAYGFGFSPAAGEYKVIRVVGQKVGGEFKSEVEVCTIGTDTWRNVGDAQNQPRFMCESFNLNGALHWIGTSLTSSKLICAFDIGEEHVRCIPPPPDIGGGNFSMSIGVLGNCLSIFDHSCPEKLDIWSMKDYGVMESWNKFQIITRSISSRIKPITVWRDGEILILFPHAALDHQLLSYDPKGKQFTELKICGSQLGFSGMKAYPYVPSFLSLKDVFKEGCLRIMKLQSK